MPEETNLEKFEKLFITDIDNTLLGNNYSLNELRKSLSDIDFQLGFGVASGRNVKSIIEIFNHLEFMIPDIIISSVGSEIFLKENGGLSYSELTDWKDHLSDGWNREEIVKELSGLENMEIQEESEQMKFKISYYISEKTDIEEIKERLNRINQQVKMIVSKNKDLDILPERSGKGKAIEFLIEKFNKSKDSIIVAGDSGNDEDMLTIGTPAIVVSNHSEELKKLKGKKKIYFAEKEYADGILEGLKHFNFLKHNK